MVLRLVQHPRPEDDDRPAILTHDQILPVPNPTISYWLSQPDKHANLRSTKDVPKEVDIAIIGSGMAGVLTAYNVIKEWESRIQEVSTDKNQQSSSTATQSLAAPSIVLLDARSLCSGATGRNGGHVKVKTATLTGLPTDEERNAFQRVVYGCTAELKSIVDAEPGLGGECEFELRRSFDVFCDAEEGEEVLKVYEESKAKGVEWTKSRSVLKGQMAESVTGIKGAKVGFTSEGCSFWPYKIVAGVLRRLVERYGVSDNEGGQNWETNGKGQVNRPKLNVQMNTPVTSVRRNDDDTSILTTSRGPIHCQKVIFATNAYTPGLLPSYKDTITPVKGMASHHTTPTPIFPHLNNTYNIHFAPNSSGNPTGTDYLNPRPDGSIVVGGGGWYFRDDKSSWYNNFDDSTRFSHHVEGHWHQYMQSNFLGWKESKAAPENIWVGIMGKTPDGKPHVGRVVDEEGMEVQGQWVLAGFNGGGMAMIPVVSKVVARMVVGGEGIEVVGREFGVPGDWGTGKSRMGGDE